MRSPEQAAWDLVQEWLSKAEADFVAATVLIQADMLNYETAAFHCQQAAEKFLKALLVRHQIEFTKTHDLGELLLLADNAHPGVRLALVDVEDLTTFAVDARYPGSDPLMKEEAKTFLEIAGQVRERVRNLLDPYLQKGRPEGRSS